MRKEEITPRFGPGCWATLRDTGEHVKVEVWSTIAAAYRLRSRKNGLLFATDAELDEVPVHPDVHLGKHWSRCHAAGCNAPLTPSLPICPKCQAPTCTCGRCACIRPATAARARAKVTRKKVAAGAQR
jgi:hypothetical protein